MAFLDTFGAKLSNFGNDAQHTSKDTPKATGELQLDQGQANVLSPC